MFVIWQSLPWVHISFLSNSNVLLFIRPPWRPAEQDRLPEWNVDAFIFCQHSSGVTVRGKSDGSGRFWLRRKQSNYRFRPSSADVHVDADAICCWSLLTRVSAIFCGLVGHVDVLDWRTVSGFWFRRVVLHSSLNPIKSPRGSNGCFSVFCAGWPALGCGVACIEVKLSAQTHSSSQSDSGQSTFCSFYRPRWFCLTVLGQDIASKWMHRLTHHPYFPLPHGRSLLPRFLPTFAALFPVFCNWQRFANSCS